ncbi:MAG: hypothetical protein WB773_29760, partial [Isosphaeraceae bacterium]
VQAYYDLHNLSVRLSRSDFYFNSASRLGQSSTLNALRQDLTAKLDSDVIHAVCRAAGHTWYDSALLTPTAIIPWFLLQDFHGNTALNHVALMAGRA